MTNTKIVRDTAGNLYRVSATETENCYFGYPVKRVKGGYAVKGTGRNAEARLIRKLGCTEIS